MAAAAARRGGGAARSEGAKERAPGMEDGVAGPRRLGEAAAEAVEARAPTRVTLRPFAPFSAAAPADEGGSDWSFIDCEMEEVDLQDLPSATIACHLDPRVFVDGLCRVRTARPAGRRADTCCGARPGRGRAATLLPGVAGSEGGLPFAPPTWSRSCSRGSLNI